MTEIAITSLITKQVSDFSRPIFEALYKQGQNKFKKLEVDFNFCFTEYLKRNFEKCSKTKTILYRDQPVKLREFYVRTDLVKRGSFNENWVQEDEVIDVLKNEQRIVISGRAGSGKSTFCKSVFIDLVEGQNEIIPIFVELRYLNSYPEMSVFDYIVYELKKFKSSFDAEQLSYSLKLGKVLLILDGFDEVNKDKIHSIEKEIIDLASQYSRIMILCSSRPDERFISWGEFYTYRILPLDKTKALNLIDKINFDLGIKANFMRDLENNLYDKHTSFASTPLLLTIMLLTYEQIAEVPEKIHLFYQEAFATLFHKHDAYKSSYKRKTYTDLSIDDFAKLLSTFCFLSYSKEKYSFSEQELFQLFKYSRQISKIDVKEEDFLKDLLFSVCILQKDALEYTFTHRSFQEYFTALFLTTFNSSQTFNLFEKVAFINRSDNIIFMSFEINRELVEREWFIPKLEWFLGHFNLLNPSYDTKMKNVSLLFSDLEFMSADDVAEAWEIDPSQASPNIALVFSGRSKLRDFYKVILNLYRQEIHDFIGKVEYSENEIKCKEKLLSKLVRSSLVLSNPESISVKIKELVEGSGCLKYHLKEINFIQLLLHKLKEKYEKQERDIEELILQSDGSFEWL